jgi:hypothetical protein
MKLSINAASAIAGGLRGLDGYQKLDATGKPITEFFKLDGDIRLNIAIGLNRIDAALGVFSKARQDMARSFAGDTGQIPPDKQAEFVAAEQQMLAAEQEIDIPAIPKAALKLDDNPIPGTTLSLIVPILAD